MATNQEEIDRLKHDLTNHSITDQAIIDRIVNIRNEAKVLGVAILELCPPSRERSLAKTNLEQAVMWAVASLARNQDAVGTETP